MIKSYVLRVSLIISFTLLISNMNSFRLYAEDIERQKHNVQQSDDSR